MNSLSLAIVCGCFVLLLSVQYTEGIQCYSCIGGTSCDDEFNPDGVPTKECAGSCLKTKTDNGIGRGCLPGFYVNECEEEAGAHICACDTDLCNGSTNLTASVAILIVVIFVVAMFDRL